MDAKPSLKAEPAFQRLEALYNSSGKQLNMNELFAADAQRFDKFRWVQGTDNKLLRAAVGSLRGFTKERSWDGVDINVVMARSHLGMMRSCR